MKLLHYLSMNKNITNETKRKQDDKMTTVELDNMIRCLRRRDKLEQTKLENPCTAVYLLHHKDATT